MLIKHVRDFRGVPFATIVATSPDNIGLSICNSKDRFSKRLGIKIAEGRSHYSQGVNYREIIPNRRIDSGNTDIWYPISRELEDMKDRAKRYFK